MSSRRIIRTALVAISVPLAVTAQERPDVTSSGNGARAIGLGYATTALADDISSIGWNPAGLTYIPRAEFGFSGGVIIAPTLATGRDFTPTTYPILGAAGEYTGAADAIEFAGLAKPFRVFGATIAVGAAYRRFTDGPRAGTFETLQRLPNGRYNGSTSFNSSGGMRALSPTLAVAVTNRIRLGATANILTGSTTFTLRELAPAPVRNFHEKDYSGMAIQAGALYAITNRMQIGVNAVLPHDVSFEWDNDTTVRNVTRAAPLALSVGFAYDLDKRSTVTLDLRHAPWSKSTYTEDASGDTVSSRAGVNDANSFHIGFEKDVSNEQRNAAMRFGLFGEQSTYVDIKGKSIRSVGVAAGRSWYLANLTVDLGMLFSRSSYWTRSEDSAMRVKLANQDFVFSLGFRRHF